jgi:hypothetical protein
MAISDKTRKRLWAKSGNRCAISKVELVVSVGSDGGHSVVGEECHICAREPGEARYDPSLSAEERDAYDNLILLSRDQHKVVDDNPAEYTSERLRKIKADHEEWVRLRLALPSGGDATRTGGGAPLLLKRIGTGTELLGACGGSHLYDIGSDELEDEWEVALVAGFLQDANDWVELWDGLEIGERTRAGYALTETMRKLEENGFWVFADVSIGTYRAGEIAISNCRRMVLRVVRMDSPAIISLTHFPHIDS